MIVLDARFESSAPEVALAPADPLPEVCFAGRSNVGKSSALNALVGRKQLARVSGTPGRTRLLNFFRVELADKSGPHRKTAALRLCDLPGYGFARAPAAERKQWAAMIGGYLQSRESLRAVVLLVDLEVGPQPRDLEMMEFLGKSGRPLIVLATKADRVSRTRSGGALDKAARDLGVPREAVIRFSAVEGIGRDEAWDAICNAADVLGRRSDRVLEPAPETPEE